MEYFEQLLLFLCAYINMLKENIKSKNDKTSLL